MKRKLFVPLILVVFLLGVFGCAHTIGEGEKPILTMNQIRELGPRDLADFAITLYNKRADWYKIQMEDPSLWSENIKKELRKEYKLLTESWPFIDAYDRIVVSGGVPGEDLQIELYKFIQKYLGGV